MYTGFKACIFWNGLYSSKFAVNNGVEQEGNSSPMLFWDYFDILIIRINSPGSNAILGWFFLQFLSMQMTTALLAPTATAMRHLQSVCDILASDFDVRFNAQKSKCIFFDV